MSQASRLPFEDPAPPLRRSRRRSRRDSGTTGPATERLALIRFEWPVAAGVQPVLYLQRTLLD
jgi:hypothetical protein